MVGSRPWKSHHELIASGPYAKTLTTGAQFTIKQISRTRFLLH